MPRFVPPVASSTSAWRPGTRNPARTMSSTRSIGESGQAPATQRKLPRSETCVAGATDDVVEMAIAPARLGHGLVGLDRRVRPDEALDQAREHGRRLRPRQPELRARGDAYLRPVRRFPPRRQLFA